MQDVEIVHGGFARPELQFAVRAVSDERAGRRAVLVGAATSAAASPRSRPSNSPTSQPRVGDGQPILAGPGCPRYAPTVGRPGPRAGACPSRPPGGREALPPLHSGVAANGEMRAPATSKRIARSAGSEMATSSSDR